MNGGLLQVINDGRGPGAQSADELEAVLFEAVVHPAVIKPTVHTDDGRLNVVLRVRQHLVYLVLDAPAPLDGLRRQRHGHLDVGETDACDMEREGTPVPLIDALDADGLVLVRDVVAVKSLPVLVFLRRVAAVPHQVGQVHGEVGPLREIAVLV